MITRTALLYLSKRYNLKDYFSHFDAFNRITRRFIAGEEINEAIFAIRKLNGHRSEREINDLLAMGAKIRLCKGAYAEPASVAFPRKRDVDANYVKLMRRLLLSGIYHGIATHDEKIIAEAKDFAAREGVARDAFEFQMLYGIRRDLQVNLIKEGYQVRTYVPYGAYWYPYFMRRLAERPANIWFVLKNMLREE